MPELVRVQKVLADAGVASRRQAEALIAAGRVSVDGHRATIGQQVDPQRARLAVDGRPVTARPAPVHLLLAKPAGVTSTVRDRHAARTVIELVPPEMRRRAGRLYPVGRLDRDSEGLLLLTNDGDWAQRVLHPSHGVARRYAVGLAGALEAGQRRLLEEGIRLAEGMATLEQLRPLSSADLRDLQASIGGDVRTLAWYELVLRQGWKRQVRRMFSAVGAPVARLVRVGIGELDMSGLRLGELRPLADAEVAALAGRAPSAARQRWLPVVAIDGPGGSGKSTVGAEAAQRLGYRFCDTGVLYRGLTWLALEERAEMDEPAALLPLVDRLELAPDGALRYLHLLVDGHDVTDQLHTAAVDRHVSQVSRHAPVRAALLPIQRRLAAGGGMIMAGRDIGSVVLPDADLKIYLDVSIEERTRRRAIDRGVLGNALAEAEIEQELRRRDGIDSSRETAPLRVPDGALVVHTEGNTFEQTVGQVVALIEQAAARGG